MHTFWHSPGKLFLHAPIFKSYTTTNAAKNAAFVQFYLYNYYIAFPAAVASGISARLPDFTS